MTRTEHFPEGEPERNASSGDFATNASSGDCAKNASSGDSATNASSGDFATNASSGDCAKNASAGAYSKNVSNGAYAENEAFGHHSVIAGAGLGNFAKGVAGTFIMLAEYGDDGLCVGGAMGFVGEDGIPPDTWLIARGGKLVPAS